MWSSLLLVAGLLPFCRGQVMWSSLLLVAGLLPFCRGHPQCLDYRAPFKPSAPLSFCTQYSDVGCCSPENDKTIAKEFEFIKNMSTPNEQKHCLGYAKELLCQSCSPYAAHIYDAEGKPKARAFPGLCLDYCKKYHQTCHGITMFLDRNLARRTIFAKTKIFCETVSLDDPDYCYPDLLSNPIFNRNISRLEEPSDGCLCLEKVKGNIANPLWARHAGDGSGRLFVALQKGEVYIYNTRTQKWNNRPFLNLKSMVLTSPFAGDERGFLGVAFHPNYSNNGRFFVFYSTQRQLSDVTPAGLPGVFMFKTRVSEMRVSENNPDCADPKYEKVLFEVLQPFPNHNGGELMFGLDGYLYAFVGDGGAAGDILGAGQNKSLIYGKVLRLDVDSDPNLPYTIPPDNPFVNESSSLPEIYAYGIRNIWRCGLDQGDRDTGAGRGRILCGDVGQNKYEEIDLLKKGANYGWNSREGFECFREALCGNIGPEELPLTAYDHSLGKSVTGGVFYRGCENPALNGKFFYGDYASSRLWSLIEDNGNWTSSPVSLCGSTLCDGGLVGSLGDYILSFGEDEEGEIYVLTSKSSSSLIANGNVYKVIDPMTRNDPSVCNTDLTSTGRVPISWKKSKSDIKKPPKMTLRIRVRKRKRKKLKLRRRRKRFRTKGRKRGKGVFRQRRRLSKTRKSQRSKRKRMY